MGLIWKILRNTHPVERYWGETWLKDIRGTPTQLKDTGQGWGGWFKDTKRIPIQRNGIEWGLVQWYQGNTTQWKGTVEKGKIWIEAKSEFYPWQIQLKWEREPPQTETRGIRGQPLTLLRGLCTYKVYTCKYLLNWGNYAKEDPNLKCPDWEFFLIFQNINMCKV